MHNQFCRVALSETYLRAHMAAARLHIIGRLFAQLAVFLETSWKYFKKVWDQREINLTYSAPKICHSLLELKAQSETRWSFSNVRLFQCSIRQRNTTHRCVLSLCLCLSPFLRFLDAICSIGSAPAPSLPRSFHCRWCRVVGECRQPTTAGRRVRLLWFRRPALDQSRWPWDSSETNNLPLIWFICFISYSVSHSQPDSAPHPDRETRVGWQWGELWFKCLFKVFQWTERDAVKSHTGNPLSACGCLQMCAQLQCKYSHKLYTVAMQIQS